MNLPAPTALDLKLSQRRHWAADQSISYLMEQGLVNRDVTSLAAGFVDETTLPVELVRNSIERILDNTPEGRMPLQYGPTGGDPVLRDLLLDHLAENENRDREDLGITAEDIVITSGSQQFLQHLADVLFDPGDICLVAGPTYFVFLGALNGVSVRTVAVETDDDGMRMDSLAAELDRIEQRGELERVKLIYLVSSFENPSGITLAEDRRREAVEIAQRYSRSHRILILEDAAYRELRYDGEDLRSVWSFDESHEHVILAQTFSKSFSPGLRVAYAVMPADLIRAIHDVKGNFDFGSPNLNQNILADVLRSGEFRPHVKSLQHSYRIKRDAMLAAADQYFGRIPGAHWIRPEGGLYVWMSLPQAVETGYASPLFKCATQTHSVMYVPGEISYPPDSPHRMTNQMRLSFGVESPETIADGMRRLSEAVLDVLSGK